MVWPSQPQHGANLVTEEKEKTVKAKKATWIVAVLVGIALLYSYWSVEHYRATAPTTIVGKHAVRSHEVCIVIDPDVPYAEITVGPEFTDKILYITSPQYDVFGRATVHLQSRPR